MADLQGGRKKNVTGQGKDVYKRGEGLGSGPVGTGGGGPNPPSGGSGRVFGYGQTFRAGTIGALADKTAFGYVSKYDEEHGIRHRVVEKERIAAGCVGIRRTTGQHPGGIVVLPVGENIYSFTPVQHPANDMETLTVTTHFDYHSIDHNLLKLDILGHDDPTMIRMLEDLTGLDAKTIPMDDPGVISLFKSCEALGVKPSDIDDVELGRDHRGFRVNGQ